MAHASIETAIESYGPGLMELKYVVGIGESCCNGEPCIRVYLEQADHETLKEIPAELDGITVTKAISGPLRAAN